MARKWWTLILVCVATFMLLLDITIVNVALPDIQIDLGASLSSLQWVVDAYALTLATSLLIAGSVGDRVGRRRVFSFGFGLFTLASLLCGVAGDPTLLNLARGLQGIGGGAMFATALALIAQEFEGRERATAIGAWGATVGGAVAIGPLVGGLLTEGLGWEWIFFINVPIGIAAVVLTERKLVNVTATDPQPLDWPGLITFAGGLFLLIFGLIRGNPEGWSSAVIVASLGGAVALLTAFVLIESRRENAMLDMSLFRKPSFTGVSIAAWALSAGMFAMFLYLTLYIQNVLEFSPLEAGVRFLPITLLSFFVAPVAGKLSERISTRILLGAGLAFVGAGLLAMRGIGVDSEWTTLLARVPARRDRDRADEPGDRLDRDRGRLGRPGGNGVRDQQHLPPGRDRHRGRRPRRRLPVADRLAPLGAGAERARGARRDRRRRGDARRGGGRTAGRPGADRRCRHSGVRGSAQ